MTAGNKGTGTIFHVLRFALRMNSGIIMVLSNSRSVCGRSGSLFLHNNFYKTKTHAAAKQKRSVGTEIAL